jgi:hypothetical protein
MFIHIYEKLQQKTVSYGVDGLNDEILLKIGFTCMEPPAAGL